MTDAEIIIGRVVEVLNDQWLAIGIATVGDIPATVPWFIMLALGLFFAIWIDILLKNSDSRHPMVKFGQTVIGQIIRLAGLLASTTGYAILKRVFLPPDPDFIDLGVTAIAFLVALSFVQLAKISAAKPVEE